MINIVTWGCEGDGDNLLWYFRVCGKMFSPLFKKMLFEILYTAK